MVFFYIDSLKIYTYILKMNSLCYLFCLEVVICLVV